VLQILPVLAWLAATTSAVLLVVSWRFGEPRRGSVALFSAWFLAAAYCQFLSGSPTVGAAGLCLQTMLAIVLIVRRKLG
jgi:hypothetical protein